MMLIGLLLAASGPVYLTCELQHEKPFPVQIAADEANGRATVTLPATGRVVARTAVFDERSVTIPDDPLVWRIDRVTLDIRRSWLGKPPADGDETGKCKLAKPPTERAF